MFDKWPAEEIAAVCQRTGLKIVSAHISYPLVFAENLPELIRFAETVGMKYAVVAAVPEEEMKTRAGALGVAARFNAAAATLKSAGIRIGYHNHGFDFKPIAEDGSLPWDIFFDNTNSEVVMQLDIGNALHGGADPVHYLQKYPGRARMVHVKEFSTVKPPAAVGDGQVDWPKVLGLCEQLHQPEWYIIEQEEKEHNPWDSAAQSLAYLRSIGW
jgi:sugar phosphate isomerase/epimerase